MSGYRWLAAASCSGLLVVGALACGSFSGADTPSTDAGPGADSPTNGDSFVPGDGPIADDGGAPSDGGGVPFEIANGLEDVEAIAVTDSAVYVVEHDAGKVLSFSINGGMAQTIDSNAGSPLGIAVSGGFLYSSNYGGMELKSKPLGPTGAAASALTPENPFAMAPTSTGVVVLSLTKSVGTIRQYGPTLNEVTNPITNLGNLVGVAAHGDAIYWTESDIGRVAAGVAGAAADSDVALGEIDCQSIAADAVSVYWALKAGGVIRRKGLLATGGVETLAAKETSPHSLVADGTYVYWLTGNGNVRRAKNAGSTTAPVTVASGYPLNFAETRVQALAMNAKYLVWITTDGRIVRFPR